MELCGEDVSENSTCTKTSVCWPHGIGACGYSALAGREDKNEQQKRTSESMHIRCVPAQACVREDQRLDVRSMLPRTVSGNISPTPQAPTGTGILRISAASPDQTQLSASAISAPKSLADVTGHLEMQVSSFSYPLNGALQPRSHALSPPRLGFSALASSPISAIRP